MRHTKWLATTAAFFVAARLAIPQTAPPIPSPPREFRAAWVATVANIDWPSQPGLPTEQQKAEALAILDRCRALNLNAVIFQVRPQADAFYASELEPWSYFLTGQQGKAPEPFWDPLAFWVEEAHARGLELHAWLNPYRANHPAHKGELSERSLVKARPELVVKLGDKGYYWMDPALTAVQDHSVAVTMDVVTRYDVDAVHFDDYFYPYPEYNGGKDFPDDASWEAFRRAGGQLSRGDWRRKAVNIFIERVYRSVKKAKPRVKVGISPFGIWRPGFPKTIRGFDPYNQLYADARLWLRKGWVDYFTPQLYWPISRVAQSFPVLLGWWQGENVKRRHLWPGMSLGRAAAESDAIEAVNQVMVTRGMGPEGPGQALFSMKGLMKETTAASLVRGPYAERALVPASPWLDKKRPRAPTVSATADGGRLEITWTSQGAPDGPFLFVVYTLEGGSWSHEILPRGTLRLSHDMEKNPISAVAVSAVDRCGNESERTLVSVPAPAAQ
jgi:uncharacterized lipoprotein YddW (UPF0748 family)